MKWKYEVGAIMPIGPALLHEGNLDVRGHASHLRWWVVQRSGESPFAMRCITKPQQAAAR